MSAENEGSLQGEEIARRSQDEGTGDEENATGNRETSESEEKVVVDNAFEPQLSYQEAMQMFCSGFNACSQEAVRYLIEEEGLSPTDPFVVALHQHLLLQETYYLLQCIATANSHHSHLPSYEEVERERNSDSDYCSASEKSPSVSPAPSALEK